MFAILKKRIEQGIYLLFAQCDKPYDTKGFLKRYAEPSMIFIRMEVIQKYMVRMQPTIRQFLR